MSEFRRRLMMAGGGLPYDAELDYIESDGNQYIDTGITQSSNTGASMTYTMTTGSKGDYCLLGIGDDRFRWGFAYVINASLVNYMQPAYPSKVATGFNLFFNYNVNAGVSHEILYNYLNDKECYIDNTFAKTLTYGNLTAGNIWMFGFNYGGGSGSYDGKGTLWRGAKVKIHKCTMTTNNTIVRDFIPVRVGQVGYMYDKISGALFGNLGTGDFTIGNDIN